MKKNTFILVIFNLVNTAAQFILIIILTRFLDKVDYATYRQFFLPFEIGAPLLGLGLSSSIFYFYPRFDNKRRLLIYAIILVAITNLLLQILLNFGIGNLIADSFENSRLKNYFYLLGVFSFFSVSSTILYSYFILENNTKRSLQINFIGNIFLLASVFFVVIKFNDLHSVILLRTVTYGIICISMLYQTKIYKEFHIPMAALKHDLKEIFLYTFPVSLSLIIGTLSYQIDKFIAAFYTSPSEYAIYINGAFEVPLISIITSSIAGASFGLFTTYCKDENFGLANQLFKKVSVASALFLFPSFIFLFIYAEKVIILLFGSEYGESYHIFRIYLLLLPIRIIQYGNILIALNKTKVLLARSIVETILSIVLSVVFYFYLGIFGIAFGVVMSVLLWTVPYNLIIISKGFGIPLKNIIPSVKLLKIVLCSVLAVTIVFAIGYLTKKIDNIFIYMILNGFIYCIIYIPLLFFLKLIGIDRSSKFKVTLL